MDPTKPNDQPITNPLKPDISGPRQDVTPKPEGLAFPASPPPPTSSTPPPDPVSASIPTPPASVPPETSSAVQTEEKKPKTGLVILVVLIVLLAIAGLIFVFFNFSSSETPEENIPPTPAQRVNIPQPTITGFLQDEDTDTLNQQGITDEVDEIEKDLNNTDFTNLDKEVDLIEGGL